MDAFRQELSKFGWIEGKNIAIEYRFAEETALSANLSLQRSWFVLRSISLWSQELRGVIREEATTTIPIVMTRAGDPVALGLVASLARPGGNITGSRLCRLN